MSSHKTNKIVKNTVILYVRMFFTMLVSLYTTRVVLTTLGIEDYGIYNIIGGIIIMFSFINNAMTIATQRFLAYELGLQDFEKLKKTFSMSMTAHISIALLIIILSETVGLWFVNNQLNIPGNRMYAANWVYQFTILTFTLNVLQVPYNASVIAHEKMTFYAYLSVIEVSLKLIIVFLLQYGGFDILIFYSILVSCVSIIILLTYKTYCTKKFESCNYHFFWDSEMYKKLLSFLSWSLLGNVSLISAYQGVNIMLNIFIGVTINAAMGIANQVTAALNGFVGNFQTAFKPQIIKSFASGDHEYLMKLIFSTSKISFFLLFILAAPIIFNMDIILDLWLKNVPEYAKGHGNPRRPMTQPKEIKRAKQAA